MRTRLKENLQQPNQNLHTRLEDTYSVKLTETHNKYSKLEKQLTGATQHYNQSTKKIKDQQTYRKKHVQFVGRTGQTERQQSENLEKSKRGHSEGDKNKRLEEEVVNDASERSRCLMKAIPPKR